jgi:ankyrin repeat protein
MGAARRGDLAQVGSLIAAGADVNAKDEHGQTAVMCAAQGGHGACVNTLIAAGADVNAKRVFGRTALMMAANAHCVKALIAAGADVNARDSGGETALMWAADKGEPDGVKALIVAGADANVKSNNGGTALINAARKGVGCVKALIAAGADVNAKCGSETPLIRAAQKGDADSVKALIAAGADVNAKDVNSISDHGQTALMWAACRGHVDCATVLVAAGADVNARDNRGKTALMYAEDHPDVFAAMQAASQSLSPATAAPKITQTPRTTRASDSEKDYGRLFVWPNRYDSESISREFYARATSQLLQFPVPAMVAVCLCRNQAHHFCAVFAFSLGSDTDTNIGDSVRSFLKNAGCPAEQETESAFYERMQNPLSGIGDNLRLAGVTVVEGRARNLQRPGRPFDFYLDTFPFKNFLEWEEGNASKQTSPTGGIVPGDVFVLPLGDGLSGAFRVVRLGEVGRANSDRVLLVASGWIGRGTPSLSDPKLRQALQKWYRSPKGERELELGWIPLADIDAGAKLGNVPLSEQDRHINLPALDWNTNLNHMKTTMKKQERLEGGGKAREQS